LYAVAGVEVLAFKLSCQASSGSTSLLRWGIVALDQLGLTPVRCQVDQIHVQAERAEAQRKTDQGGGAAAAQVINTEMVEAMIASATLGGAGA
jgi:hypothetical protein